MAPACEAACGCEWPTYDTLSPYLFILLCVYALNMTLTATYRKTHSDDNNFCSTCAAGFYRAPGM
jgi:hypothetical protein